VPAWYGGWIRITALQDENTGLREHVATLTVENRTLKDEIARLKELPQRTPDKPSPQACAAPALDGKVVDPLQSELSESGLLPDLGLKQTLGQFPRQTRIRFSGFDVGVV
jgi:hypothetical protein